MALDDAYRNFVAREPAATVWHEPAMLEAVTSVDRRLSADYVGVEEDGVLVGAWPFCRKARLDGWAIVMPPLLRYCGPVFDAAWLKKIGREAALRRLWEVLPKGYRNLDQDWAPSLPASAVWGTGWRGDLNERQTHLIDLSVRPDAATAGRTKQMRKDLRRASAHLHPAFAKTVSDAVHDLLEAPYRRQEMAVPYERSVVDAIVAALAPSSRAACLELRDDAGALQAAAVFLADGHTGYAWLAGATAAARKYSGSNYAVAVGPEWAARLGLGRFDFLGSDAARIADTLRRMGGVPTAYAHLSHDTVVWTRALRAWRERLGRG